MWKRQAQSRSSLGSPRIGRVEEGHVRCLAKLRSTVHAHGRDRHQAFTECPLGRLTGHPPLWLDHAASLSYRLRPVLPNMYRPRSSGDLWQLRPRGGHKTKQSRSGQEQPDGPKDLRDGCDPSSGAGWASRHASTRRARPRRRLTCLHPGGYLTHRNPRSSGPKSFGRDQTFPS